MRGIALLLPLIAAAPPAWAKKPAPARKAVVAGTVKKPTSDRWYTVTVDGRIHYSYFRERFEKVDGRIRYESEVWTQEEGFVNREAMGAFAKDDGGLTPLFFNFQSFYRNAETAIDGTVADDRNLSVRVRKGDKDQPIVQRRVPKGVFFASFFPLWLRDHLPELKPNGAPVAFESIPEDAESAQFKPEHGLVRMERPDDRAAKTGTKRLLVRFRDVDTVWWVRDDGSYLRTEMPLLKRVVSEATADEAKRFFDGER